MPRRPSVTDDRLLAWLSRRSVPCPWCAYDLRQVRELRCPECGRAIELESLGNPELGPNRHLRLAVGVLAAMGIPFGGLGLVTGAATSLGDSIGWLALLRAASLINAAILFVWTFATRWMRSWPARLLVPLLLAQALLIGTVLAMAVVSM